MKDKVNESKSSINIERKIDINYDNIHSMKFIDIIDSESNKYIIPGSLKNELIKKKNSILLKNCRYLVLIFSL